MKLTTFRSEEKDIENRLVVAIVPLIVPKHERPSTLCKSATSTSISSTVYFSFLLSCPCFFFLLFFLRPSAHGWRCLGRF